MMSTNEAPNESTKEPTNEESAKVSTNESTKGSTKESDKNSSPDDWKKHDIYHSGVSCNRILTRSQTAFLRFKNTTSNLDLFSDASRHQPPGQPHLLEVMKGTYGAIPRTIITRSASKFISVSEDLEKKLDVYKKYEPSKEEDK